MNRKPYFEGSGKANDHASDEEEELEDEDKRPIVDGRRARARQLLSEWGW